MSDGFRWRAEFGSLAFAGIRAGRLQDHALLHRLVF